MSNDMMDLMSSVKLKESTKFSIFQENGLFFPEA